MNKTDELIRSITDGLGDVFYGIYIIDLVKNEYVINSSREVTRKAMENEKDATAALRKGVSLVVAPEYRDRSYEFNDFFTLPERLKNRQSITLDFVDVYGNKCNGSFLACDRDENGMVTKVLYVFRYTDSKENDAQINKDLEAKNSSRDCVIKSDVQLSARIQEIEALYDSLGFAEWRFEIGKNGKITDVIFDSKIYKMLGYDDTNTKLINGGIELISFVHPDDLEDYLKQTSISYLENYFSQGKTSLHIFYTRKYDDGFQQVMMELIPATDYCEECKTLFLYVKNIDI